MSKSLASTGLDGIRLDIFGRINKKFKVYPPESFDFFNSLKLHDSDSFAGVTVVLVESIFWEKNGDYVSQLSQDGRPLYSGSEDSSGNLPDGVTGRRIERWIVVASYELHSRTSEYKDQLAEYGCNILAGDEVKNNSFLIFLRAKNLLSFNESKRLEVAHSVAAAPDDPGYDSTPFDDLLPYYESFELYKINELSVLRGRSIFWVSYIVAAYWSKSKPRHLTDEALSELMTIYTEARWHFPIDNARTAVVASHFKHCFIELYRCLEWLYALPRAIAVKKKLGLAEKATELARTFRTELGWRRAEADSLRLLLRDAGVYNYKLEDLNPCLVSALPPRPDPNLATDPLEKRRLESESAKWEQDLISTVSDRIYRIRNQFVHQIEEEDIQPVGASAESHLIRLLCWLCAALYRVYAPEFPS